MSNILHDIQKQLKAPKNQLNKFGGYNYRSCEDILEAVKPLLPEGCSLILSDTMVEVGGRVYVKAKALLLTNEAHSYEAEGWAREAENKKGMDDAQITGAASSYARKYALNGLFCIDDTKDADATNEHSKNTKSAVDQKEQAAIAKAKEIRAELEKADDKPAVLDAYEQYIERIKAYPKAYREIEQYV